MRHYENTDSDQRTGCQNTVRTTYSKQRETRQADAQAIKRASGPKNSWQAAKAPASSWDKQLVSSQSANKY